MTQEEAVQQFQSSVNDAVGGVYQAGYQAASSADVSALQGQLTDAQAALADAQQHLADVTAQDQVDKAALSPLQAKLDAISAILNQQS